MSRQWHSPRSQSVKDDSFQLLMVDFVRWTICKDTLVNSLNCYHPLSIWYEITENISQQRSVVIMVSGPLASTARVGQQRKKIQDVLSQSSVGLTEMAHEKQASYSHFDQ